MLIGTNVRLRPIERDDLPRYVQWFGDPEVRRHLLVYLPFSLVQEEKWFEGLADRMAGGKEILLAIDAVDGTHIGNIGLQDIDWKNRSAELGIVIGEKAYWGQGYGADAIRTLLRTAFEEMNLHRIFLRVDADNARGIGCYQRCGFRQEGVLREGVYRAGRYHDQWVMSILRPEFQKPTVGATV